MMVIFIFSPPSTLRAGTFNSIAQNSMIGMVSAIGGSLISIYWVATGISGLSMNISQAMAIGIFGQKTPEELLHGTIFYYLMAAIISISTIFLFKAVLDKGDLIDSDGQLILEKADE